MHVNVGTVGEEDRQSLKVTCIVRGQHPSLIAIMSTAGLLDCETVTGAVDGDQ